MSVVKTIMLSEQKRQQKLQRKINQIFPTLQYHKMVQKAPTKFFASQKSNFESSWIFEFSVTDPRANYTTLH